MIKKTLWGIVFLVSIYAGLVLFITKNQRNMQYEPGSSAIALSDVNIERAENVTISTGFLNVYGWYAPPIGNKPVIIYFKGNEGSFSEEYERFAQMSKDGYGFLAFDYRGFPLSPGKINQENILNDALAVFDWVEKENSSQEPNIVLFGRSLGSGPATYVASRRDAKALILESPFTSAVNVAKERFPFLPVANLLKDKYPVNEWIKNVSEPVFVSHGTDDEVISVSHGKQVYNLASNGKKLWIVEGANHGNLWQNGLWDNMKEFLN